MPEPFANSLQLVFAALSVPAVAAGLLWIARRFTKESRLLVRTERLAALYPNLPDGPVKDEFAQRVNEAAKELNARLDPLFRRERRLKRRVVGVIFVATLPLVFTWSTQSDSQQPAIFGVACGIVMTAAFAVIERDTRRQRAALAGDTALT